MLLARTDQGGLDGGRRGIWHLRVGKNADSFGGGDMKERGHLGDIRVDGRIILNSSRLGQGTEAGSFIHSTKHTKILCYGYKKKCEEFLEWLRNY